MSNSLRLEDFDEHQPANDFRRANGAPMVRRVDDPTRWDRYARPSGFGSDLDDEDALNNWRVDRAIEGVATHPALAAAIAAGIGRSEGRKDRREQAITLGRGEEAADLGTALHAMAHRMETDPGFKVPPPYDADLAAYVMALDKAGLESTHFEVHVCSDSWRAAGTADRIYRATRELKLPGAEPLLPGQSVIGDLKTGAKWTYAVPGHVIQIAIYADGCFYDVVTDERSPFPDGMRLDWGLLVHLPVGEARCDLHWADLQTGRIGAALVRDVRRWRKREDYTFPFLYPTSDVAAVLSSPIFELETAPPPENPDQWLEAMLPWTQERINEIGRHPDARALLLRRWPADVPPLRAGGVSPDQLARVLDVVDAIESAFSLPWPPGDPRVEWQRGVHRTEMDRTNEPMNQGMKE